MESWQITKSYWVRFSLSGLLWAAAVYGHFQPTIEPTVSNNSTKVDDPYILVLYKSKTTYWSLSCWYPCYNQWFISLYILVTFSALCHWYILATFSCLYPYYILVTFKGLCPCYILVTFKGLYPWYIQGFTSVLHSMVYILVKSLLH